MVMLTTHTDCCKCRNRLPIEAFAPSTRFRSSKWCRECYQTWYRTRRGIVELHRSCDWCNSTFTTTDKRKMFCARACKDRAKKEAVKQALEASKPVRSCRHCGVSMPQAMRADAAYCSESCNTAAHSQTRKASRKIGARQLRIDRAYIIERDGGRCHLCGAYPEGRALTIDHVMPLARGGTHTSENLRVACLSCNCSKRDRVEGEICLTR
jgi:hypothetical protein